MSTRSKPTSDASAEEIFDEIGAFLVGGGLITMVLFPLAVPIILLVIIPLIPIVLVAALAGGIVAAPWLLFRLARSLVGRRRERASRPLFVPDPEPVYRDRTA